MRTGTLLAAGTLAGPLFVAVFLVAGAARADYDPLRHPVSSLALGPSGPTQTANFVVAGLLTLALAGGLRRALPPPEGSTWGPLLIGVWAVGLLGAGLFAADPVSGYPPGLPDRSSGQSRHGALHGLSSLAAFAALAAACVVFGRHFARWGERRWVAYSPATGLVFGVSFVLSSAGFAQAQGLVNVSGLFQRVAIIAGFGWLTLLAVHARRSLAER